MVQYQCVHAEEIAAPLLNKATIEHLLPKEAPCTEQATIDDCGKQHHCRWLARWLGEQGHQSPFSDMVTDSMQA